MNKTDPYQDIRDAVRDLCAQFPDEYHRRIDAARALIAAECMGDGYWFIDRVTHCVKERVVFGRPTGQNQGAQFPITESYIEVEAADLMRWQACALFGAADHRLRLGLAVGRTTDPAVGGGADRRCPEQHHGRCLGPSSVDDASSLGCGVDH